MSMTSSIYYYDANGNKAELSYWQNNHALHQFMCERVAKSKIQDVDDLFITIDDLYSAHITLCNVANCDNLDYLKMDCRVTTQSVAEIKKAIQFAIHNPMTELFYECGG